MPTPHADESAQPYPSAGFTGRKTLVATAVAVVLIAGALLIRPARPDDPRPPRPQDRAMSSVGLGAPASATDLGALIDDRESWLREHDKDAPAWSVLGSAYLERGRRSTDTSWYPKAERALKRSLQLTPAEKGNYDAMVAMGALAVARHDFRTGKKWGELVRAQSPQRWTAYPVLVDAYTGLGEYKSAEAASEKLLSLRPGLAAYTRAAQVYRDRGWREDATAAMENAAAAARTPAEKVECLYRLGELSWERGEAAEALRMYEGAQRADGTHHQSLGGKARALAALDRHGEAVKAYRTALTRTQSPQLALELGELLESMDRGEEAAQAYALLRSMTARAASHGMGQEVVSGLFEADHGDPVAAVKRLRAEWDRHPNVQVADALGWALHQTGADLQALEYAKKATDQGLRSADFSYHRAVIEQDLGDWAAARRHLDESLRTNPRFSPVRAPLAKEALAAIKEPSGGPQNVHGSGTWTPPKIEKVPTPPRAVEPKSDQKKRPDTSAKGAPAKESAAKADAGKAPPKAPREQEADAGARGGSAARKDAAAEGKPPAPAAAGPAEPADKP
ncbi:hypothetical protein [Streptomyces sp. NPDC006879]|uniref:tetratricopeptide repeat protein n=1 Tax=Streptomyces sp. NPDC006879 TaxID=3364767 RepID=UPI00368DE9C6